MRVFGIRWSQDYNRDYGRNVHHKSRSESCKIEKPVTLQHQDLGSLESSDAQPDRQARLKEFLREVIETLLLAAAIYLVVNVTTARRVVEGPSMEPTLHSGQFLLVNRLAYHLGEPERGDIIVFHSPSNSRDDLVKRIIGLPGEAVTIREGFVYIDGQLLQEPYISTPSRYGGTWEVPEDHYFVLGDNRNDSSDSHNWSGEEYALPADQIIGEAWLSYWPPEAWGVASHYHDYSIGASDG